MKGPFHRLRYNLRRVWECQSCHHKCSTSGSVTSRMCDCKLEETGKRIPMRLVADGVRRVQFAFETNTDQSQPTSPSPESQNLSTD